MKLWRTLLLVMICALVQDSNGIIESLGKSATSILKGKGPGKTLSDVLNTGLSEGGIKKAIKKTIGATKDQVIQSTKDLGNTKAILKENISSKLKNTLDSKATAITDGIGKEVHKLVKLSDKPIKKVKGTVPLSKISSLAEKGIELGSDVIKTGTINGNIKEIIGGHGIATKTKNLNSDKELGISSLKLKDKYSSEGKAHLDSKVNKFSEGTGKYVNNLVGIGAHTRKTQDLKTNKELGLSSASLKEKDSLELKETLDSKISKFTGRNDKGVKRLSGISGQSSTTKFQDIKSNKDLGKSSLNVKDKYSSEGKAQLDSKINKFSEGIGKGVNNLVGIGAHTSATKSQDLKTDKELGISSASLKEKDSLELRETLDSKISKFTGRNDKGVKKLSGISGQTSAIKFQDVKSNKELGISTLKLKDKYGSNGREQLDSRVNKFSEGIGKGVKNLVGIGAHTRKTQDLKTNKELGLSSASLKEKDSLELKETLDSKISKFTGRNDKGVKKLSGISGQTSATKFQDVKSNKELGISTLKLKDKYGSKGREQLDSRVNKFSEGIGKGVKNLVGIGAHTSAIKNQDVKTDKDFGISSASLKEKDSLELKETLDSKISKFTGRNDKGLKKLSGISGQSSATKFQDVKSNKELGISTLKLKDKYGSKGREQLDSRVNKFSEGIGKGVKNLVGIGAHTSAIKNQDVKTDKDFGISSASLKEKDSLELKETLDSKISKFTGRNDKGLKKLSGISGQSSATKFQDVKSNKELGISTLKLKDKYGSKGREQLDSRVNKFSEGIGNGVNNLVGIGAYTSATKSQDPKTDKELGISSASLKERDSSELKETLDSKISKFKGRNDKGVKKVSGISGQSSATKFQDVKSNKELGISSLSLKEKESSKLRESLDSKGTKFSAGIGKGLNKLTGVLDHTIIDKSEDTKSNKELGISSASFKEDSSSKQKENLDSKYSKSSQGTGRGASNLPGIVGQVIGTKSQDVKSLKEGAMSSVSFKENISSKLKETLNSKGSKFSKGIGKGANRILGTDEHTKGIKSRNVVSSKEFGTSSLLLKENKFSNLKDTLDKKSVKISEGNANDVNKFIKLTNEPLEGQISEGNANDVNKFIKLTNEPLEGLKVPISNLRLGSYSGKRPKIVIKSGRIGGIGRSVAGKSYEKGDEKSIYPKENQGEVKQSVDLYDKDVDDNSSDLRSKKVVEKPKVAWKEKSSSFLKGGLNSGTVKISESREPSVLNKGPTILKQSAEFERPKSSSKKEELKEKKKPEVKKAKHLEESSRLLSESRGYWKSYCETKAVIASKKGKIAGYKRANEIINAEIEEIKMILYKLKEKVNKLKNDGKIFKAEAKECENKVTSLHKNQESPGICKLVTSESNEKESYVTRKSKCNECENLVEEYKNFCKVA